MREISDATLKPMLRFGWLRDQKRFHIVLVLLVVVPLYAWNARWDESANPDTEAVAVPAWQFSATGSLDLTEYEPIISKLEPMEIWFVYDRRGRLVSQRPPGLIGVAVPAYIARGTAPFSNGPATIVALVMTTSSLVVIWMLLRRFTNHDFATVATVVLALGTTTWAISSSELWPHGPGQLWAAIALVGMSRGSYGLAGAGFAVSVLTRPLTGVFAAVTGLVEGYRRRQWRPVVVVGLTTAIGVGLLLAYNRWIFGSWSLVGGYSDAFASGAVENFAISDYLSNVYAMFIGVPNGFLLLSPVIGIAVIALARRWREVPGWARSAALSALAYLLIHAALNRASGGLPVLYRYPLEAIALATPALAMASWLSLRKSQTWLRLLTVTAVLSVAIQAYYVFYLSCILIDPNLNTCL